MALFVWALASGLAWTLAIPAIQQLAFAAPLTFVAPHSSLPRSTAEGTAATWSGLGQLQRGRTTALLAASAVAGKPANGAQAGSSWLLAVLGASAACGAALRLGARSQQRRGRPQASLRRQGGIARNATVSDGPPYVEEAPANLREMRIKAGKDGKWLPPTNDRLIRAAKGEMVDRPPKWMMRQAGRYLPEYRALLKHSDFFTVCKTPELACEITLQPYRRYPTLDSLIIFSDILVIPVAMGMGCRMEPNGGPKFDFAIETPKDLERINLRPDVQKSLGYVFDAVFLTRQRVNNEVPVIGFSGAPWTLMGYMVQGGASRGNFDLAKKWLYLYPEESRKLLGALREIIVEYLVGQYDSGAPLLTLFDTNCGEIPPRLYEEFCVPDLKYIAEEVKRRRPGALLSIFAKDGELAVWEDSAYDVVQVSWKTSAEQARAWCPSKTLQGNLDPHVLFADPSQIKERAASMVNEFGVHKYIANLGHGMMPAHVVEGPQAFMDAIDEGEEHIS